jgi:hypothetical protein
MEGKDFAREALTWFFRRQAAAGKGYCAACLIQQLTRRASGAFTLAGVQAVVAEVFEHPSPLRVTPQESGTVCQKRRRCLGTASPGR